MRKKKKDNQKEKENIAGIATNRALIIIPPAVLPFGKSISNCLPLTTSADNYEMIIRRKGSNWGLKIFHEQGFIFCILEKVVVELYIYIYKLDSLAFYKAPFIIWK